MLPRPTLEDLQDISEDYNLKVPDEKLNFFLGAIGHHLEGIKAVDEWKNPLDDEKHKYGERPFHRATPQENPYNAWYSINEIQIFKYMT